MIGVTGSTGKTSTKDLLHAVLAPHRRDGRLARELQHRDRPAAGDPRAPRPDRGAGARDGDARRRQIAELAADRRARRRRDRQHRSGPPRAAGHDRGDRRGQGGADRRAAARRRPRSSPPASRCWTPHLRDDATSSRSARAATSSCATPETTAWRSTARRRADRLEVPFTQAHLRRNLLAAVAAARAVGVHPEGRVELALSPGRGQRAQLHDGVTLIDDCYNANPMSMRAALDDLAETASAAGTPAAWPCSATCSSSDPRARVPRRARRARRRGRRRCAGHRRPAGRGDGRPLRRRVLPVADAGEAAALLPELLAPGDAVLVKASRGVGLEVVCAALRRWRERSRCAAAAPTGSSSGRVLIAGTASLLMCVFLARSSSSSCAAASSARTSARRDPRATRSRRARRRWAGSSSSSRSRSRS